MRKKISVIENDDGSFTWEEETYVLQKVQSQAGIVFVNVPDRRADGAKESAEGIAAQFSELVGVKRKG